MNRRASAALDGSYDTMLSILRLMNEEHLKELVKVKKLYREGKSRDPRPTRFRTWKDIADARWNSATGEFEIILTDGQVIQARPQELSMKESGELLDWTEVQSVNESLRTREGLQGRKLGNVMTRPAMRWNPKPPMISNWRPHLGVAPVAAVWPWVVRIGVPLLVGAGVIYASSSLVKSAIPKVPINTRNIPTAAILGGLGVASYYASGLLPEKWTPVGYIAAALGVASSIYMLFKDAPVDEDPGAPTPAVDPEAYTKIRPIIEEPKRGQTVTIGLILDTYSVRMTWVNTGDIAVPFNYRFNIAETPQGVFGQAARRTYIATPKSSDPELKPMNRLTLMPKDSLPVVYEMETSMTGWVANTIEITVEVFNPHVRSWIPVAGPHSFILRKI